MKNILNDSRQHILRLDPGDEMLATLASFCNDKQLFVAYFFAIGTVKNLTLSYYDLPHKVYKDNEYNEDMEIASLTGNIALMDGKIVVHAHGVFSNQTFVCFGGHVKKLVTSATCEVFLIVLNGSLEREYSEETGLNLLK